MYKRWWRHTYPHRQGRLQLITSHQSIGLRVRRALLTPSPSTSGRNTFPLQYSSGRRPASAQTDGALISKAQHRRSVPNTRAAAAVFLFQLVLSPQRRSRAPTWNSPRDGAAAYIISQLIWLIRPLPPHSPAHATQMLSSHTRPHSGMKECVCLWTQLKEGKHGNNSILQNCEKTTTKQFITESTSAVTLPVGEKFGAVLDNFFMFTTLQQLCQNIM